MRIDCVDYDALKQLLYTYVEQGLNAMHDRAHGRRSAASLPRLEGALPIASEPLSNAGLFEWLDDAWVLPPTYRI